MYAEDEVIGGEEERSVSEEALVWEMAQCEGRRPGESGEENQIRPELDGMRRREEGRERRWSNRKLPSLFCRVPILFGLSSCGDKTLDMCAVRGKGKKRVLYSYVQRRGERASLFPFFCRPAAVAPSPSSSLFLHVDVRACGKGEEGGRERGNEETK